MPDKIVTVHAAPASESPDLDLENESNDVNSGGNDTKPAIIVKKRGVTTPYPGRTRSRSAVGSSGAIRSIRSMNMIVSENEIVHDQPPNIETVPDEDEDGGLGSPLSTSIVVAAVVHLVVGIVSMSVNLALFLAGTNVQKYLEASGSSSEAPSYIIFLSEGLTIICGVAIFFGLFRESQLFFYIYPHILWLNVVLDIVAITYSAGGWRPLNKSLFERIFESKALGVCRERDDLGYRKVFQDYSANFWTSLETDMKCCGINGPKDWILLCDRIPDSCCVPKKKKECRAKLKKWNAKSPKEIKEVRHLLHSRDCKSVLNLERASLKRDYIIYPAVILFFDLILLFSGNHLTQQFLQKLQSADGKKELKMYRKRLKEKLCCKQKKNKVVPVPDDESETPDDTAASPEIVSKTTSKIDVTQAAENHAASSGSPNTKTPITEKTPLLGIKNK